MPGDNAIRILFNSVGRDEQRSEKILRCTKEASLMNIPGGFPTPPLVAEQLVTLACIEPGHRISQQTDYSNSLSNTERDQWIDGNGATRWNIAGHQ
jgi:hypothetical protein